MVLSRERADLLSGSSGDESREGRNCTMHDEDRKSLLYTS